MQDRHACAWVQGGAHRLGVCDEEGVALLDVGEDHEHDIDDAVNDDTAEHCPPVVRELASTKVGVDCNHHPA